MPFKDGRSSKQRCLDMDCGKRTSAVAALRDSGRADSSFAALCWLLWPQSGPNKITSRDTEPKGGQEDPRHSEKVPPCFQGVATSGVQIKMTFKELFAALTRKLAVLAGVLLCFSNMLG